jgi:hypothetical protein
MHHNLSIPFGYDLGMDHISVFADTSRRFDAILRHVLFCFAEHFLLMLGGWLLTHAVAVVFLSALVCRVRD